MFQCSVKKSQPNKKSLPSNNSSSKNNTTTSTTTSGVCLWKDRQADVFL